MGAVATYSYAGFQAQFPSLASVPTGTVQSYWTQAGIFHDNTPCGPIVDPNVQAALMNMMAAHLLVIFGAITINTDGTLNSGVVGRVSNASEGSVSVATENDYPPGTPQWYQQTPFGSAYWLATSLVREMLYVPGPRRRFNPPLIGPGYWNANGPGWTG